MKLWYEGGYTVHTEQSIVVPYLASSTATQQQLTYGCIAIGTVICLTAFVREIRLLIEASKT